MPKLDLPANRDSRGCEPSFDTPWGSKSVSSPTPASRGRSVLVDEPAEDFASVDAQRGRTDSRGRDRLWRLKRERAVRPVPVVVREVVPEHAIKVASVQDQNAVEALARKRSDPALGV